MGKLEENFDVDTDFDWAKVYELPWYFVVRDSSEFLVLVAFAKQNPIGVVNGDFGWGVLFLSNEIVKGTYKLLEDETNELDERFWNELRNLLCPKDIEFYELLLEVEREKSKARYETWQ